MNMTHLEAGLLDRPTDGIEIGLGRPRPEANAILFVVRLGMNDVGQPAKGAHDAYRAILTRQRPDAQNDLGAEYHRLPLVEDQAPTRPLADDFPGDPRDKQLLLIGCLAHILAERRIALQSVGTFRGIEPEAPARLVADQL